MNRPPFTLRDLKLQLPPVNQNTTGGVSAEKQTIRYKYRSLEQESQVTIIGVHQFGFRFCFENGKREQDSLLATVAVDPVNKSMEAWAPPRWYIFKSRGVYHPYEITHVSWDPDYKERFVPKQKTKLQKELDRKVRSQLSLYQ